MNVQNPPRPPPPSPPPVDTELQIGNLQKKMRQPLSLHTVRRDILVSTRGVNAEGVKGVCEVRFPGYRIIRIR